jgi:hypothetical protein
MGILFFLLVIGGLVYLFTRRSKSIADAETPYTADDRYNFERKQRQQQVDRLLEKVARKGMSGLSEKEKKMLREHAQSL